jgi:rhamnose transport system permease protein
MNDALASLGRYKRELPVAAAYAALLLALALFRPDFYHRQFRDTWISAAPVLVAAVGMTLVILARQIDISIGSQISVCAVLGALAAKSGLPMPLVLLCAVACGAAFGAVNGWLVAFRGLPSIVVTLATMVILQESLRWAREGAAVRGLPPRFQWFGLSQGGGEWLLILTAGALFLLFAWASGWLAAGRAVYAVGSEPEAARLAGVRPRRVTFVVFVLMGALAGLAAVVVGGTAITGGRGTLVGTLIGVALLGAIRPTLAFLNLQPEWERAVQGLIILLAVAGNAIDRRTS